MDDHPLPLLPSAHGCASQRSVTFVNPTHFDQSSTENANIEVLLR
jgi:hypothetical protein